MPYLTTYPSLKQCEPTSRNEVTKILTDISENGVIRGRVMYDTPVYQLNLTHNDVDRSKFAEWENWLETTVGSEILVTWAADQQTYRGIFSEPPSVSYAPFQRFNITSSLLVKKVINEPQLAIPGKPGRVLPITAADLNEIIAAGPLGNTDPWVTGQYVILLDASECYWDGSTWKVGRVP